MSLIASRRLAPLLVTQTLGAINDNLFKNALVVLVLLRFAEHGAAMVAAASGVFILPYVLLSATAGQVVDRFEKRRTIIRVKLWGVAIMGLAAAGFLLGSAPLLFAVLLGLGVQATFFGPLKYAILGDHLAEEELVAGNGLIEAGTFLGILVGTIAGAALVSLDGGPAIVSAAGALVAVGGLLAAVFIPRAASSAPDLRIGWNVVRETAGLLRAARENQTVWLCILGLSWFWVVGATMVTELPVLVQTDLLGSPRVITLLLAFFSVGVGAGSVACARLLKGEVSVRHAPFAALGLSVFIFDFATAVGHARGLGDVRAILTSFAGWRMLVDLLLLAACGGLYSVPLYAMLQDRSAPAARARMVAANNVVNAAAMVAGAAAAAASAAAGLRPMAILMLTAAANLVVCACLARILSREMLRTVVRWYCETFHGVDVAGLENLPAHSQRAVYVVNHQSFADGCFVAAYLPGEPVFAVNVHTAKKWWARPALAAVRNFPVDPTSPFSVKSMVSAVRGGSKLVVFPEGRLTTTGGLMKVYEGAGLVADKAGAVLVPVRIDGLQFTPLSRLRRVMPRHWFPRLSLTVLPAAAVAVDPELRGRPRRRAVGIQLQDLMERSGFSAADTDRTLFGTLLDATSRYGEKTAIIEDGSSVPLGARRALFHLSHRSAAPSR